MRDAAIYRSGAFAVVAYGLMSVATFAFYGVSTRRLGVESGGTFLALVATVTLPAVVIAVLVSTLTPTIARWVARDQPERVSALIRRTAPWFGLTAVLVLVAAVVAHEPIALFLHLPSAPTVVAGAAATIAFTALQLTRVLLQATGKIAGYGVSNLVETMTKGAGAAALFALPPSVETTAILFAIALAVPAVYTLALVAGFVRANPAAAGGLRGAYAGSLPVMIVLTTLTVLTLYDAIVARRFLDAYQAGLYNAAALIGRALLSLLGIVPALLMPIVASRTAVGGDAKAIFRVAVTLVAAAAALVVVLCALRPDAIVGIIAGGAYRAAAPLVAPYALAAGALAVGGLLVSHEIGAGRPPAMPVAAVGIAEICVALAYHPSAERLIAVVLAGHVALLVASAIASRVAHRTARASLGG